MTKPMPKTWHDGRGYKCHLLAIVNDGDIELVTYKWWSKPKARWRYEIEPRWLWDIGMETIKARNKNKVLN